MFLESAMPKRRGKLKAKNDVVLWLDEKSCCLKALAINDEKSGYKFEKASISQVAFRKKDLARIIDEGLKRLSEEGVLSAFKSSDVGGGITLVLPNGSVVSDMVAIPSVLPWRCSALADAQIKEQFSFVPALKFKSRRIKKSGNSTIYRFVGYNTDSLNRVQKAFAEYGILVERTTYSSAAAINALYKAMPEIRAANLLFIDVKADSLTAIAARKTSIIGFFELPCGASDLFCGENAVRKRLGDENERVLAIVKHKRKKSAPNVSADERADSAESGMIFLIERCIRRLFGGFAGGCLSHAVVCLNFPSEFGAALSNLNERVIQESLGVDRVCFCRNLFDDVLPFKSEGGCAVADFGLPLIGGLFAESFNLEDYF